MINQTIFNYSPIAILAYLMVGSQIVKWDVRAKFVDVQEKVKKRLAETYTFELIGN